VNCVCCNNEIPVERVEAIPGVQFCVKCAAAVNPKHVKLSTFRTIEESEDEELDTEKAVEWNSLNDVKMDDTDEEALKQVAI